jgi:cystathionine beta-lyase/cystathionine gamma-synthase
MGTRAVHAGTHHDPLTHSAITPVFHSTTYGFSDVTYESFAAGVTRDVPIYTRYGNPNQWVVQEKVATLEGAESAVATASGMAAIYNTILALTNRGGHIISSEDVYGGTYTLFREDVHQIGRSVTLVDPTSLESVRNAIQDNTQLFFFESLSNPLLKAIPLPQLAKLAHENHVLLVVDNTFLSPIHCQPLRYGADVVIHSCSKYLNGHSDVIAGVVSSSRKYADRIWAQMLRTGGQLDPHACYMLERGMKTLELRVERQSKTAAELASFLEAHELVERVYYPTLESYEWKWVHEYTTGGFGGIVSFQVKGGDQAALRLLDGLSIPIAATSLGGVESLVSLPFNTSHSVLTADQRQAIGIPPGLVRLSVGIENTQDLVADVGRALASLEITP